MVLLLAHPGWIPATAKCCCSYLIKQFRDIATKSDDEFKSLIKVNLQRSLTRGPILYHRGQKRNLKAYVHVVGLGLGVWMIQPKIQNEVYLKAFENVLERVELPHVSDIDFRYSFDYKG